MTVTAYLLIQADVGTAAEVARQTAAIESIISADAAMGPYDVIARAQADNVDDLGKVVVEKVQMIAGVERTLLCPVVNL